MTFDRIIVGVDRSDYDYEALRQALVLRAPDGTLEAITVLDSGASATVANYDELRQKLREAGLPRSISASRRDR